MLFHILEGAKVVTRTKGVMHQRDVYHRNGELFAKHGNGFIGLRGRGGTSVPHIMWEHIDGVSFNATPAIGPVLWADYEEDTPEGKRAA